MSYKNELLALCGRLGCQCRENEPLKAHTTFKIGGNAEAVVFIDSSKSLSEILGFLKEKNVRCFVIGKGSNILADDNGFDGVIIKIGKDFSEIKLTGDNEIYCTAGASLSEVCKFALDNSLTGLEFAYGIPGTAGGGLYMNAGAYGGELKDVVKSAHYIDTDGGIKEINAPDMELAYRTSIFAKKKDLIITDMTFSLKKGDKADIKAKMDELMDKRRTKQPLEYPSAGSTFKRPEGSYASLLIEECGLKGLTVGGAQVSEKHSGFVINVGGATFDDVMKLTQKVQDIVLEKTGFKLELEPIILR